MPVELDRICRMLEGGEPELRCAAALVLGELRCDEAAVRRSLLKALRDSNESVRLYAAEALARIHPSDAIPHLLPFLSGPEPNRSRAVRALANLGPSAAAELRRMLGKADAAARQGILDVLGRFREVDTSEVLLTGLLDSDPDVARQAASSASRRLESLDPGARKAALRGILDFMASPRARRLGTPLVHALRIVGATGDHATAGEVSRYLHRQFPLPVRAAALEALARIPLEGKGAAAVASAVLPVLEERDAGEVLERSLEVLRRVPAGGVPERRLLGLLQDSRLPVRLYALEALGASGSAASAEALKEELDPSTVRKLLARCLDLLDRRDPRAPAFFEVVRSAAPALLREALLRRGRERMRRGRFEEAESLLGLLHREDLAAPETELALAVARLRLQRLDPAAARRDQGGAIQTLARLARLEGFSLAQALPKEAGVSPAVLLYVGFFLAERPGKEGEVGREILRGLARKYPAREEGRVARAKLRTQGTGPGEEVRP